MTFFQLRIIRKSKSTLPINLVEGGTGFLFNNLENPVFWSFLQEKKVSILAVLKLFEVASTAFILCIEKAVLGFNTIIYMEKTNKRNGFTFIEMLLAVSLVGLISLALYQSLSNGLRIWKHAQRFVVEEDIGIFLEKISHDLRNTFQYSLISFDGKENKIAFPTIVRTLEDKKRAFGRTNYIDQIGKAEYSFDKAHKTIFRRQANYGQAMEEDYGVERLLVKPVHSLKFFYYYIEDGKYEEKREVADLMPFAVRVEIEFFEDTGQKRIMERVIPLPVNL